MRFASTWAGPATMTKRNPHPRRRAPEASAHRPPPQRPAPPVVLRRDRKAADAAVTLQEVLRPLARVMIRGGLGAGQLTEAAKLAYVLAAIDEVIPAGRRPNVSQLSVVTGLTRKEIAAMLRQREASRGPGSPKPSLEQRAIRVLRAWRADPAFQRQDGRPADLPPRGDYSFAELVKRHGRDVTPVSLLKELRRMNAVVTTRAGKLRARSDAIQTQANTGTQLTEFAALLRDFAVAAEQLDRAGDPPPLVEFKDLRLPAAQQVALFLQVFSKRAAGLLEGVDQWMRQQGLATHDKASGSAESRVGIGVYLLHE